MSKARNAKLEGQTLRHRDLGKVLVLRAVPGSFSRVEIKVLQRKAGWDDIRDEYRPVKRTAPNPEAGLGASTIYWDRRNRDEYGLIDECHVNELIEP